MTRVSSQISLEGLRFHAFHGVLPQERQTGHDYVADVTVAYDASRAMASDDIRDALNYAEVYQAVKEEMAVPSALLEHVCGRIARHLFDAFKEIDAVRIRLMKVNPPMGADCQGASVELFLTRDK